MVHADTQMDDLYTDGLYFSNQHAAVLPDSMSAQPGTQIDSSTTGTKKTHAACDECRKRKLKCSGEPAGCTRCIKYSIPCIYSPQKQMGRPKKRQRQDGEMAERSSSQVYLEPTLSAADEERSSFENVCPGPMGPGAIRAQRNATASLENTPPSDHPRTPSDGENYNIPYPTDYSIWPDFTETTVPMPLQDSLIKSQPDNIVSTVTDSNTFNTSSSVPDCPCLPNLYLTLSTLTTLVNFPISAHTITTLQSAHRAAQSVIYCRICPQKFQSGSQNVFLSNTLLIVLVDHWARVLKQSASELEKGFSQPPPSAHMSALTELEWRTFAYDLVRAHVFGDKDAPSPPTTTPVPSAIPPPASQILPLMSLAEAMERRQKQWHGMGDGTAEFADKMIQGHCDHGAGLTLEDIRRSDREREEAGEGKEGGCKEKALCIQIVDRAKQCIQQLDRRPPVLGDCGLGR